MKNLGIRLTYEQRRSWAGRLFILPWLLGFLLFFAKPLLQSVYYTFCEIKLGNKGYEIVFKGLVNYIFVFTQDPDFFRLLLPETLKNLVYEIPIIAIFSLFIAALLNQKFRGRGFVRAIFFLPVIITSGIIIHILKQDIFASSVMQSNSQAVYMFKSSGLQDLLLQNGLDYKIVNYFTEVINRIFDLTWKSGVQILLFLAGLQTIPGALYEAADVEGSTAWESFWKITFPMVSPYIVMNIIYTIIDTFTDYGNTVMQTIYDTAIMQVRYAYSCTLSWIFLVCVFTIIGIVNALISKRVYYMAG
jgi:ABC-type sugar transport systems, permease components